jgi:hypothetical protein
MAEEKELSFVRTLDQVQDYVIAQEALRELLRSGLFSIAQTKYSKGCIGQQQYDMEMEASARVDVLENSASQGSPSTCSTFELHRGEGEKDPLAWFGVMVPPSLRDAQQSFKQALEVVVQLANHAQQIKQGLLHDVSGGISGECREVMSETSTNA